MGGRSLIVAAGAIGFVILFVILGLGIGSLNKRPALPILATQATPDTTKITSIKPLFTQYPHRCNADFQNPTARRQACVIVSTDTTKDKCFEIADGFGSQKDKYWLVGFYTDQSFLDRWDGSGGTIQDRSYIGTVIVSYGETPAWAWGANQEKPSDWTWDGIGSQTENNTVSASDVSNLGHPEPEPEPKSKPESKQESEPKPEPELKSNPKTRVWTSANGQFTIEATFVKSTPEKITLEKKDGTTIDVKWEQLSEEDQQFVKKRKWEHAER